MRRRWVMIDSELVEVSRDWTPEPASTLQIVPDIQSYVSMADGSVITSRSKHRAHLKQHNMIEIGNDSSLKARPKPLQSPPGLKEEIIRVANQRLRS